MSWRYVLDRIFLPLVCSIKVKMTFSPESYMRIKIQVDPFHPLNFTLNSPI